MTDTLSYESALVSTGRRMCLGDVLARMELFLFFSSVLHLFHLELPKDQPLPSLRGNAGITVTPDTYKVVVTKFWVRYVFLYFISRHLPTLISFGQLAVKTLKCISRYKHRKCNIKKELNVHF